MLALVAVATAGPVGLGGRALAQQAPSTPAAGQSDSTTLRARQLFQSGVSAYEDGRYAEALKQFQEAYRLRPHPLVRVNIANCYDKLDRPGPALENFEAFLASGEGSHEQQAEVRTAVAELQRRVGYVRFNVSPPGAQVVIDGRDELHAPIVEPVTLAAGRHQVNIALGGHETALRVVDVVAQQTTQLDVDLPSLSAPPSPEPALAPPPPPVASTEQAPNALLGMNGETVPVAPPTAPPPLPERSMADHEPTRGGLPTSVWAAGGATLVLTVSAIVTGQLALSANREFDSDLAAVRNSDLTEYQRAGAWAQGVDAASRADALAAATDVLLALALAGAGLTTYLYLAQPTEPSRTASRGARLTPGLGSLRLQGRF